MAEYRLAPRTVEAIRLPAAGEDVSDALGQWLDAHDAKGGGRFESGDCESLIINTATNKIEVATPGDWLVAIPQDTQAVRCVSHELFVQLFFGPLDDAPAGVLREPAEQGDAEQVVNPDFAEMLTDGEAAKLAAEVGIAFVPPAKRG